MEAMTRKLGGMTLNFVATLAGIALLLLAVHALAQDARTQTFPLGKEFPAQVLLCMDKDAAVNIADTSARSEEEAALLVALYVQFGACGQGSVYITYQKLVHRITKDKVNRNVYEAKVNGQVVYVVTIWNHVEIRT